MNLSIVLDEKDKRIRKRWLIAFVSLLATSTTIVLIDSFWGQSLSSEGFLYFVSVFLLTKLVFSLLMFYFSYWRYGTKLLMFYLILQGIRFFPGLAQELKVCSSLWDVIGLLICSSLVVWFYISSIFLYGVNKKIKCSRKNNDQEIPDSPDSVS